ncbi:MAG: transcriptional regulator [Chloroflexi bacterium]|nr:MAG: transcriptional regulator [Chloroflexota bacterium]
MQTKPGEKRVSRYAKLVCLSGPRAGTEYELTKEIIAVGRSNTSDIVLEDQFASRQHAEIRRVEVTYQVHDLKSKNGVTVDGVRLAPGGTAWLQDGSEVQFASTRFRFQDPSATLTAPALIAVREPGLRVEPATRQVFVDGAVLDPPLSVKQFDLLWYLYQNRGRVVSKDEIAQAVWPEAQGDVYDANIDRMISRLRSRIEPDSDDEPRFIATIRGYGFQLLDGQ